MALWLVQGKDMRPVRRLESVFPVLPENREGIETQELFQTMHDTKLWLICGCRKPDARMFVRKLPDGRYALVNHSEHGVHDPSCPLATNVKGEAPERSAPDSDDGGAAINKQSEYRLLTPYRKVDLLSLDGVDPEEDKDDKDAAGEEREEGSDVEAKTAKSPAAKIDFLYQLMWQLIDDAFCAHRHPGQHNNPGEMQAKLRSATGKVNLKGFGPLIKYTFTGSRGLEMLYSSIARAQKATPKARHQYLFLAIVADYAFTKVGASVTMLDGSALMLGQAVKRPLVINGMGEGTSEGPFLLAAIYGYKHPADEHPMILKWALQPLVSKDNLLPANSWAERMLVAEMTRQLDNFIAGSIVTRPYKLWLYKPVLPSRDPLTSAWLQPVLCLVGKDERGERCRVAFRPSYDPGDIGAYQRTFEHVHTIEASDPAGMSGGCEEMFTIGRGVIEQHFLNLEKERREQEGLAASQDVGQRMQQREMEIFNAQQEAAGGPATEDINDQLAAASERDDDWGPGAHQSPEGAHY